MRSQVKLRSSDFHPLMSPKGQERILRNHRSMSALPPKADIGTGPRITFDAASPAAWRYSPQSAALSVAKIGRATAPIPATSHTESFGCWLAP